MAKKKAREDEAEAAAAGPTELAATKRRRRRRKRTKGATAGSASSGVCDDVLRSIFARVPARTAVASMALSKHHRGLMRCPDFIALHCRLSPPLPGPHLAFIATATVSHSTRGPVTRYHGFHIAGGGNSGSSSNAPMRALAGPVYVGKRYVNTCNGVVLLAGKPKPNTCVLWNPAIADEEKEVTVPVSARARDDCEILGLGYGPWCKTYKILLRRRTKDDGRDGLRKELLVYALGGTGAGEERPRLRSLSSTGLVGEISGQSLYMDGTIYVLHLDESVILAFDVDDETVTTIYLPGEMPSVRRSLWSQGAMSTLFVMSGRPCVDVEDDHGRAMWLLTVEHQWEMRCIMEGHRQYAGDVLSLQKDFPYRTGIDRYSIAGVWDCGGVLVMYLRRDSREDKLFLYCTATKKLIEMDLPASMTPELSGYAFCWGYKPTLVSPGSLVVGELEQDEERRRHRAAADIMAALEPVSERDRRTGQEATLDTVCFMELLLRIMRKLPENLQDVAGMPFVKSEDSDPEIENAVHCTKIPDLDPDSSAEDEIYHSDSESGFMLF